MTIKSWYIRQEFGEQNIKSLTQALDVGNYNIVNMTDKAYQLEIYYQTEVFKCWCPKVHAQISDSELALKYKQAVVLNKPIDRYNLPKGTGTGTLDPVTNTIAPEVVTTTTSASDNSKPIFIPPAYTLQLTDEECLHILKRRQRKPFFGRKVL